MKVLMHVDHAFSWAHGGVQVLVENLMRTLPSLGIAVEPLRWWDDRQTGDIIHVFYRPGPPLLIAKSKAYKVVGNVLLDFLSSNSSVELLAKKVFIPSFKKVFPNYARDLGWFYGDICDACIYPSLHEMQLGASVFGADPHRGHVILHGVDHSYFEARQSMNSREDFLISVATIHPRKNNLLLAQLARELEIPVLFLGKPYADDSYFREFMTLVDGRHVIYPRFVSESAKRRYLSEARGFVLLSRGESGCIAALEAVASGCPLLLSDLPWARSVYNGHARFAPLNSPRRLRSALRRFYDSPKWEGPELPVETWDQVATRYVSVYKGVMASPK